ncbi:putative solute carrier family 22 member 13-like [Apostichopus japonicus]|uniref:Putative solute carrier family 22 member 13-like n=1 Tax=Stichopus japonicus TaxID=307972 RepID=A0A2G8K991_STIJA|nr:putative solute carrier family 22 member 13-like [Apostichopus japonicus]
MEIDDALESAKSLGNTQIVILVATVLMNIETALTMLGNVFLAKNPPYHCSNHSGFSLNESVPFVEGAYATCLEYSNPGVSNETRECSSWEFDTDISGKSIVSEWSLVCDKDVLPRISQALVLAGFAFGSILGGPVADKYGRRPSILLSLVIFNIVGLSVSFVQNYLTFIILRFMMATIFKAVRIPIMNLLFESLVPRHRPVAGLIPSSMVSGGLMIMAGIAYLVRDWRYLNAVLMIPTLIIMVFSWFIPESVRWLLSQNKQEEAEQTMQQLASFNNVKDFPSPALSLPAENTNDVSSSDKESNEGSNLRTLLQLFKQPTWTVTAILSFNWFGTTRTLLSAFLSSSGAMLGIIIRYYALDETSLTSKILLTCLAIFGRFVMSFALLACILLMSDLFPTTMRNSGTAIVHLIGNMGSFASPLVLYLNKYFRHFALIVMVCFCLVSAGISLILPDTVGTTQPKTPADLQKCLITTRETTAKCRENNKGKKMTKPADGIRLTGYVDHGIGLQARDTTSKTNLVI